MVAAALAGVVLIHHAVHRPIAYGWLAAGILSVVIVGLAMYSRIQRHQVAALEEAVAQLAAANESSRTACRPGARERRVSRIEHPSHGVECDSHADGARYYVARPGAAVSRVTPSSRVPHGMVTCVAAAVNDRG
jgi:hypothetical protein